MVRPEYMEPQCTHETLPSGLRRAGRRSGAPPELGADASGNSELRAHRAQHSPQPVKGPPGSRVPVQKKLFQGISNRVFYNRSMSEMARLLYPLGQNRYQDRTNLPS